MMGHYRRNHRVLRAWKLWTFIPNFSTFAASDGKVGKLLFNMHNLHVRSRRRMLMQGRYVGDMGDFGNTTNLLIPESWPVLQ
jgi:hypothetical protein